MTVRADRFILETQKIFLALLKSKTGVPWTDYKYILGYPQANQNEDFLKSIVYLLPPMEIGEETHFGGGRKRICEMTVGLWTVKGGESEIALMESYLTEFFKTNSHATQTFSIVLDATYTNKTLLFFDIAVLSFGGFMNIPAMQNDFRAEGTLTILV